MTSSRIFPFVGGSRVLRYQNQVVFLDCLYKYPYKTLHEIPRIEKVIIQSTSGTYAEDKSHLVMCLVALQSLTAQKPQVLPAKTSVAAFKLRQHQLIACKVTLRKSALFEFLGFFTTVVLPRLRDFSGLSQKALQTSGTLCFGVRGVMMCPQLENHFESFQILGGFTVTVVFTPAPSYEKLGLSTGLQIPLH